MIVDLPRFVCTEKPYWDELEAALRKMEDEPEMRMPLAEVERLYLEELMATSDANEGLNAFIEKRKPVFEGR